MVLKIILGDVGIRKDPNGGYNPVITIPLIYMQGTALNLAIRKES